MKKLISIFTLVALLSGQSMVWAAPTSAPAKKDDKTATKTASAPMVAKNTNKLPEIAATAYLVMDLQSKQVIASKNPEQQIEPASLTKLMTAYLTFKALEEGKLKPKQMLTVSERGWKMEGSRMFLAVGKPASVSDLVKGLIVQSGNDAAVTLAEAIGGSEQGFAVLMNAEAKRLGMNHTHFENSTGLPGKTHLTTVTDLATLSAAIIRDYPQYYPIYSIKSFSYNNITQQNRNLLLFRDPNVDGLKTGHTNSAGYNLIASSKRNGRRVLSVVVGTASSETRATESSKLLNYALNSFNTQKIYASGQVIKKVRVYKGAVSEAEIGFLKDAFVTVPQGQGEQIQTVLETQQPILAPVKAGQQLGVLKVMDGDNVIAEQPVVALKAVEEAGFFGRIWDGIALWFKEIFSDDTSKAA
ncbi:D-alanyl-D-alanine carboxypeptidase [Kingella negevensis]|uniref:serine-type D-Ala-D-Ala carboxypeptidase n=1 Tax=Kingella negevensis TaxID=1522312 RepID=A0A238T9K4_9NEIS|nr:D-alanyl-D-alanine carboxypeptidase family protein [Kingella negevensis]MDK4680252.1 D-alanyl-D-alanine carboxypeptidase [Kingella negevensis]MDK4682028.1 D-alanyl-D-alanine carboxypeptidase [Kingella negevensis]MDK4684666.1 D-alanyl-D-alanine carboxypeptidase [Kingella negevensis]MDK4690224.1 D-alanyl-D-alanine carboxypeptidase [Kingella negevensis]MDK4692431.1 D-alanyl-D-alanine carboxypeptidase [Kingella negevensis]